MSLESSLAKQGSNSIPELPERRLLIVRELNQFSTDGIMHWTPELLETFLGWSDLTTDAPGVYRLAFVSETLTTEQVKQATDSEEDSFTAILDEWNDSLPEERRLHLIVSYGNTAATHLPIRYRCDGSDRLGRIEFFTREYFERMRGTYPRDRSRLGWHGVLEKSLQSHCIEVVNWRANGGNHPDNWLDAGFIHQSPAYRDIIMLDRTPEGDLTHKHFTV